jgi:broad specificity phosphatase PhoE
MALEIETNWYILRHALSTYSKHGYGEEILTAQILPQETAPYKKMAQYLKSVENSSNYSSEIIRCRQTAEIISKETGKLFIIDKRLNEYHQETFIQLRRRVSDWLTDVQKDPKENVIVCTHGAVIAVLKQLIIEGVSDEDHQLDYPQCGELLIIKNKELELINFNV